MLTCVGFLFIFTCSPADIPPARNARFCEVARPQTWSRSDTPETVREIKAHNAKGVAICGWRVKK